MFKLSSPQHWAKIFLMDLELIFLRELECSQDSPHSTSNRNCCNLVKQNQHQEVLNTCTEHRTTKVFNTQVPISEDTEVFNIRSAKSAQQSEALEHFNMQNICSRLLFWWE